VKVLLSVGGTTYNNWQAANFVAAAALVNDLDVDGIDFDYESESTGCTWASGGTSCSISDTQIANLITGYRNALGPNKLLTAYGWSTGAYAINGYPVYGNPTWCGLWVNPLRTVGTKIDAMWLGSYDAGPYFDTYDPRVAYDSYRALYAGAIGVGVQVAPEGWGGNVISLANVQTIANHVSSHGGQGIMIWSWQKQPSSGPNAKQIAQSLCTLYNLGNCGQRRGVLSFLKNIF
jgi:chitinase